jgi:SPP1 gp7 family putative phage head morphogenesis protein
MKALGEPLYTIENTRDSALARALKEGTVSYSRGRFRGQFTAAISRELLSLQATWDAKQNAFYIPKKDLPDPIRAAIETGQDRFDRSIARLEKELKKNLPEKIAKSIDSSNILATQLWKVDKDIKTTLKGITVEPKLSRQEREKISREWSNNLNRSIKDFSDAQVKSLRKMVKKSVLAGNRYETLIESIQKSYGVTSNKAKFLARQETNLMLAKFAEAKYQKAGVYEYEWQCVAGSPAHPVRPSHKKLNGKIFRFDDPPVTTGPGEPERRNNPGEDYNCRCKARPIVRF